MAQAYNGYMLVVGLIDVYIIDLLHFHHVQA
jgi:hypothetical protein